MPEATQARVDETYWSERLATLARVASVDAVAVVLPLPDGRYVPYAQLNVGPDEGWLTGSAQYLVWYAMQQREAQHRTQSGVPMSDGRVADSLLAAPLVRGGRVLGALVLARETAAFEELDVETASELAQLVAIELAVSNALRRAAAAGGAGGDARAQRAEEDRGHAVLLYELERLVASAPEPATLLRRAIRLFGDALETDVIAVWRHEPDGWLQLTQSRGYDSQQKPLRVDIDITLARVVRDGTTQVLRRAEGATAGWLGGANEAVLTSLTAGGRMRGALLLGRTTRPFSPAEVALAPSIGRAIAGKLTEAAALEEAPADAVPELLTLAVSKPMAAATPPPMAPQHEAPPAQAPTLAAPVQEESMATSTGASSETPARRSGQLWAVMLLVAAVIAAGLGVVIGEPLVFVLAGLLLLAALVAFLL